MRKLTLFALAFALTSIPALHADGVPVKKPASKESSSPFDHWLGITGFAGVSHTKVKTTQDALRRTDGALAGEEVPLTSPNTQVSRAMRGGLGFSLMKSIVDDRLHVGADVAVEFSNLRVSHRTYGKDAVIPANNEVETKIKSLPSYRARLVAGYSILRHSLVYFGVGLSSDSYVINSQRFEHENSEHGADRVKKRKLGHIYTLGYKHAIGHSAHLLGLEFNFKPRRKIDFDHFYAASAPLGYDKKRTIYKISELSILASFTYKII